MKDSRLGAVDHPFAAKRETEANGSRDTLQEEGHPLGAFLALIGSMLLLIYLAAAVFLDQG